MTETLFAPRGTAAEIEEGTAFQPKFDADGLIACVVTDVGDGTVLMLGYMNAEALARTIETAKPGSGAGRARASGKRARPPARS